MIAGTVNAELEAYVAVEAWTPQGGLERFSALVDTRFNGYLTLPSDAAERLQLELLGEGRAILADGSEVVSPVFAGTVRWDGESREIEIDAADNGVLLGMALMQGFDLSIRVENAGPVALRKFADQEE